LVGDAAKFVVQEALDHMRRHLQLG
jgi:hypothetical protein